jgi:hypothetical protein
MDDPAIEAALTDAETRLERGEGLSGSGFWRVVGRVKRTPELAERFADRIARIDDAAFRNWAVLVVPFGMGTVLAVLALILGLVGIGSAYYVEGTPAVLVFFAGFIAMLPSTHGLAHLVVGRLLGIGFSAWFVGSWSQPQPGIKVDYSSYLRVSPVRRAWMHASGAIATKLLPLVLIGAARAAALPGWVSWALLVFTGGAVVFDIVWSTKSSDWARFRRELALASR